MGGRNGPFAVLSRVRRSRVGSRIDLLRAFVTPSSHVGRACRVFGGVDVPNVLPPVFQEFGMVTPHNNASAAEALRARLGLSFSEH